MDGYSNLIGALIRSQMHGVKARIRNLLAYDRARGSNYQMDRHDRDAWRACMRQGGPRLSYGKG